MKTEEQPLQLQWNVGAWWGTQLGSTCWILVAGVLTLFKDRAAGLEVLAVFAFATLVGAALWKSRHRLSAYAAIQMLILVAGTSGVLTVWLLERSGLYENIQVGGTASASSTYRILIMVTLGLLVGFYFRFGRQSK